MENPLVNKLVLVRLDYLDPAGQVKKKVEVYGVITGISDAEGIIIEQANGQGEFKLALSPDALQKAQPGNYKLESTGETIPQPDYVVKRIFNAHLPPDKKPLLATYGGEDSRGRYQAPKICAHCGTRTEALHPWSLMSKHSRAAGGIAVLGLFAGLRVSRTTIYTFEVPICNPCDAHLERLIMIRRFVIGISAGLWVIFMLLSGVFSRQQNMAAYNITSNLWVIFLFIAAASFVFFRNLGHQFGRFNFRNGKYEFKNPEFFKAFAVLNPEKVKGASKL